MKPYTFKLKMKSFSDHFVSTLRENSDELSNTENFSSESVDPLEELDAGPAQPRYCRIDSIVFAEPFKNILNEENSLNGEIVKCGDKEEMVFLDNVIIQKKDGRKYKKYHMNIEDPCNLRCPQPTCIRIFSSTKLLKAHIRKVHCADRNKYMCERCGRGFSAQYLLERHAVVHSGKKVECPVCSIMLSGRTSLSTHLRSHSNLRPHQCNICHKSFNRSSTLTTHVKFVHRKGALECGECGTRFSSRKQWSQHMTSHKRSKSDTDTPQDT